MTSQTISVVGVLSVNWYCDAVHSVSGEQTRSDVGVGGVNSYCVSEHAEMPEQTQEDVDVEACSSYCTLAVQLGGSFVHTRSVVAVGAAN